MIPTWIIFLDYILGMIMWTLIGRAFMNIFQREDSTFFFMRIFVKYTDPIIKLFKFIKKLLEKIMRDKKDMSEMTDSEISFGKFLKNLGVTTHKELENLINKKIENGELSENSSLNITANIKIEELSFNHTITSTLLLPKKND